MEPRRGRLCRDLLPEGTPGERPTGRVLPGWERALCGWGIRTKKGWEERMVAGRPGGGQAAASSCRETPGCSDLKRGSTRRRGGRHGQVHIAESWPCASEKERSRDLIP